MQHTKKILSIALPAMMENILQMTMGFVDSYLIAQIGLIAVSGVSVANNIISIYQAIFIAFGSSAASLVARSLGKKNREESQRLIRDTVMLTGLLSLVLALFSIVGGRRALLALGTSLSVSQAGATYLSIVGGGSLFLGLMIVFSSVLRADNRPKVSLYVTLFVNFLNVVFSVIAIYVFHLGIIGVASATVLARIIGSLVLWQQLGALKQEFQFKWHKNKSLLSLALPATAERLMMRLGDVVIIAIIVQLGTKAVAGNAIGETLTQFNYMPGAAVATATIILVADHLGQNNQKAINRIVKESYLLSTAVMLCLSVLVFLFGRHLSLMFTSDQVAISASLIVIFYSLIGSPATSATLIMTAVWQGLGRSKIPFYATSIGMWVIRIGFAYLLSIVLKMGLSGVWLATVLDNLFRGLFLWIVYKNNFNKKQSATY
ncbi:MATE family efflux transporter [Streptococcus pacificus]|uniref:Probable multidrug resistance protein NorM n=1 Tax=Streptococcus pacificus TaxID=2740577 RepID=A0ABS0ZKH8_9STRE|nr:MATE family efflux transporter [Streptococcus pacificus]MBJ8326531.1 MATE family efflux transporter [Streptococcus pacificus]